MTCHPPGPRRPLGSSAAYAAYTAWPPDGGPAAVNSRQCTEGARHPFAVILAVAFRFPCAATPGFPAEVRGESLMDSKRKSNPRFT